MAKRPVNKVKVERWNVTDPAKRFSDGRRVVTKVAVRDERGRFHPATNFRGSVLD